MNGNIIEMLLYGFISGLTEILPVSASAHQFLLAQVFEINSHDPVLQLCTHGGVLLALIVAFRKRLLHLFRESRIAAMKPGLRKRQPDATAIADKRLLLTAVIPIAAGLLLQQYITNYLDHLWLVAAVLLVNGILLYTLQYFGGGDRDGRAMYPIEALLLGFCCAFGILPGGSAVAVVLFAANARQMNRIYTLDICLLLLLLQSLGALLLNAIVVLGSSVLWSATLFLGGLLTFIAAFFSAYCATMLARYLAVKIGFSGFAYYSWGLGFACLFLYLVI